VTLDLRISTRPEALVDVLAERLAAPTVDPFVPDLVVVPNAGMREWVATQLIDRLGVLSGIEFVFPAELARRTLGLPDPDVDPWRPERLAWHVLALMSEGADLGRTPWEGLPPRPWAVARRVADLLESTASQRPDLVAGWLEASGDAGLGPARGWQVATWRALRGRVGVASPAELLLDAVSGSGGVGGADGASQPVALPERLSVFGLSSLSAPAAAVLVEAARSADVLVLAMTASDAALREALAGAGGAVARVDHGRVAAGAALALLVAPERPRDVRQDTHPLLASWGRPALEAATMLARLPVAPDVIDGPPLDADASQLARLQAAVRASATVTTPPVDREHGGDGSVQVHACHGLVRQLEVLRDALLHAMEADESLLPRDVAVLCADLEAVAPLAVPILGADVGGRRLPVLVTDRAAGTTPPVRSALDAALALATSRLERDEVLAFLSLPVVAAALGLDADDLAVLERIADDLDVRWGRDGAHRERWGYPAGITVGSWRETLDRLLAGLLLDPGGEVVPTANGPGIAPAEGFGMQHLARIGRLADAVGAVAHLAELGDPERGPRPMAEWAAPLRWLVDTLLRPQRSVDAATHAFAAQAAQVREDVDALVADAESAGVTLRVDVREVRAALADRSVGGGSRARLRTGHVSVASLAPLRGVPFRVVAVVGVGDALLGARSADDDDVLALAPRLGERDASGERRAALLDAVLAARDVLIVTCDGQDVRTGAQLDLPTVVEELLDALPPVGARVDADADADDDAPPVVVRHPRHLADRRNLTVGVGSLARVDRDRPWTFSNAALRALGAFEAATGAALRPAAGAGVLTATTSASAWLTTPLPPAVRSAAPASGDALVELRIEDVVEALRRPARTLLRERLGVRLPRELTTAPRGIELWVDDTLRRWALGDDLLKHLIAGGSVDGWLAVRPASGGLPPGRLGRALLASLADEVVALHEEAGRPVTAIGAASPALARPGTLLEVLPVGVELDLPPSVHGVGRVRLVGGVSHADGVVVDVAYSRDHPESILRSALRLLAATAQDLDEHLVHGARVVRRATSSGDEEPMRRDLSVQGDDAATRTASARDALTALVDLALRVRSGPAALLPRAAWSIDATTDLTMPPTGTLASDAKRDLADPAVGVVLGVTSLAELADQEHGPLEEGLPDAPAPVQRWSLALREPLRRPFAHVFDDALGSGSGDDGGADGEEAS
jgi:exodeoxyribonuclease V gamma subunit